MTHVSAPVAGHPARSLSAPLRISFLINSMEGGGAERAMANLLAHLAPHLASHEVELVLLDDLPQTQTLPEGLRIRVLDGRRGMRRSYAQLARYWSAPDRHPDVCISFLARANVVNTLLARGGRHRAIISERVHTSSHLAGSRMGPVLALVTRMIYPQADQVIAVSDGVADDLAGRFRVPRANLSVIGNAIDRDRLQVLAAEPPQIPLAGDFLLGLGRLVPNKNFALLLKAYAQVPDAPPLLVLGQGPEEARLRGQAAALGIADRVQFGGFVQNPYPILARARALISASLAEGFPNTLVEAISLGCPIVAADCPTGPSEVIRAAPATRPPWPTEGFGLLVPTDDAAALAAAMTAITDDATRAHFAAQARARASDYGYDTVIAAYLRLIFGEQPQL